MKEQDGLGADGSAGFGCADFDCVDFDCVGFDCVDFDSVDFDPAEAISRAAAIDDRESHARWDLIGRLHRRTDRAAFEAALAAARSADPAARLVGLDVLGQIGYRADRPYHEETLPVLIAEIDQARDDQLVEAAISAAGHLCDVRALPAVLRHVGSPDDDVRFAVAAALPMLCDEAATGPELLVSALIELTQDTDSSVRDWATMGLGGQLAADTPAVRDALAARLDDSAGDTAGEALIGLARRHDPRALAPLLAWLDDGPGDLIVEAAAALGAPEALPALLRLKAEGWQDGEPRPGILDEAIEACGGGR